MFDFLNDEQKKQFEGMDKESVKALGEAISEHFTKASSSAVEAAKAQWTNEELPKAKEEAVNGYKAEQDKAAKEKKTSEEAELAAILGKEEERKNIKRLFNNIEDSDTFAKELEADGFGKDPKVAKLLSKLGQRWVQEQRPAGNPNPPAVDKKNMTPAQKMIAERKK